jgi:hypothetical protein
MKRLIKSAKKRSSYLIIGFLLLANLLAFGLASHYLGANNNVQSEATEQEGMLETGWQVLGWGYSLLEYIKYEPPT